MTRRWGDCAATIKLEHQRSKRFSQACGYSADGYSSVSISEKNKTKTAVCVTVSTWQKVYISKKLTIIKLHVGGGEAWLMSLCVCVCETAEPQRSLVCCVCSGSGDGGAPAEAQQNLLTVLQRPAVSHPLQGSLGLSQ